MKLSHWFLILIAFFAIAALIYSPSLGGPWQYDDYAQILDNKVLTGRPLPKLLSSIFRFTAHPDGWTGTRDLVRATFLLNWQWWGEKPLGYRWINLTIHVINATLVAALVSNLLSVFGSRLSVSSQSVFGQSVKTGKLKTDKLESENRKQKTDNWISIGSGLLFLVHPLNSQAVAYIAQRFTSVAALFYLLTIILYILYNRYRFLYNRYRLLQTPLKSSKFLYYSIYLAALISAALAYNSKEISVTLPVVLLLAAVSQTSQMRSLRNFSPQIYNSYKSYKVYLLLIPFFLLALKIPLQTATAAAAGGAVAPSLPSGPSAPSSPLRIDFDAFALKQKEDLLSRRDYFLTQISVIGTYLRLAVLPVNQTLDYDYPVTRNFDPKTLALAALHLSLIGAGGWLLIRGKKIPSSLHSAFSIQHSEFPSRLLGFGLLWFYLTLLPESSLIPIPDVIYEHRAYLPLVGLIVSAAALGAAGYNRYKNYKIYPISAAIFLLVFFSIGTLRRAYIWGNEVRLWADVYAKAPNKPRAVKNYGVVLAASGKYDDGIKLLEKAVQLDPDNADYWSNLGTANLRAGRYDPAKDKFLKAYSLLAAELGFPSYDSLNPLNPPNSLTSPSEKSRRQAAQYLNDYGVCLVQLNRGEEALPAFQKSLAIDPTLYAARLGLGAAYNLMGETQQAIDVFEAAVEEFPDLPDGYNNLAVMYKKAGRIEDHNRILKAAPSDGPRFSR